MNVLRAADKTYTAHSITMGIDGFVGRFDYFGMRREAEIIIGAEIQDFFAVHGDLGALLAGDDAFFLHQSYRVDLFQFFPDPGYKMFVHMDGFSKGKGSGKR
eukprot:Opistho-2@150